MYKRERRKKQVPGLFFLFIVLYATIHTHLSISSVAVAVAGGGVVVYNKKKGEKTAAELLLNS